MEDIIQKIKTFFGYNSGSVVDTTDGVEKRNSISSLNSD